MKKNYSPDWKSSTQPRKQRKYRAHAPLHIRRKFVSVHLDKPLRQEYKKRALQVKKGDEVVVMRGKYKKQRGKVLEVQLHDLKIFVEGIKTKKITGEEVQVALEPSNLKIVKIGMDDLKRKKFMKRKKLQTSEQKQVVV
ncbi:MAG: 50S ribosomal protein L24 [Candidatus Aenigmarchaeota archaeon]|nr:50S ribosomal protein L24 [Candidatus Aenigmarchaeota archaeon]